jgi:ABC-type Fe3+/spermidine/putrescine transport system ATPase subunit
VRKVELRDIFNFACQGTNLEVHPGELLVLLGPNGAGKTTLLNVIAGLVSYSGSVLFDDHSVDALPAQKRRVGYVFQDLVLFPHLDVTANISFGLQNTGLSRSKRDMRVEELLDLLAISHLSGRYAAKLSGGEKQRVALARALAPRPGVLLLDEPFGSLDSRTSDFLRAELRHLQDDLGTTTIFVTHDLAEAEQVADRIAVIQDGVVEQIGTPEEVLFSPRGGKVAEYLGSPNVFECQCVRNLGRGLAEADCGGLLIVVPNNGREFCRVSVLPRDVLVSTFRPATEVNVFQGMVQRTSRLAGSFLVQVDIGGCLISAELPRALFERNRLQSGSDVYVELSLMKLRTGV